MSITDPLSEENLALQLSWSNTGGKSGNDDYGKYVYGYVDTGASWVENAGLEFGRVMCVGCQRGYELDAWSKRGCQVMGVDIVQKFVDECRGKGFDVTQHPVETLSEVVPERSWNIYTCHSLEHLVDVQRAVECLCKIMDRWMYVCVPVEWRGSKDKAHLSCIKDADEFITRFMGQGVKLKRVDRSGKPRAMKANLTCLFVR